MNTRMKADFVDGHWLSLDPERTIDHFKRLKTEVAGSAARAEGRFNAGARPSAETVDLNQRAAPLGSQRRARRPTSGDQRIVSEESIDNLPPPPPPPSPPHWC